MDAFDFDNYKVALRSLLEERRTQFGGRYTFEKMAQACTIQKTYLSRVLNGKSHLSADQLFSACGFLNLREIESDFLLLIRDRQTCENRERKTILDRKIAQVVSARLKSENVLKTKNALPLDRAMSYYLNFNLHLIHLFLTVPRYAMEPQQISLALGISQDELNEQVEILQEWGLVRRLNGKLVANDVNQHLTEDSTIYNAFAILQRVKTIERMNKVKTKEDYFFSALISADKGFQVGLRKKILALLENARKETEDCRLEEVFQLNIDLFQWSKS